MTTIGDHIKQLFEGFRITLNEAAIAEMANDVEIDGDFTPEVSPQVNIAILRFAPILLLTPSSYSVSENGHSKSQGFDREGFLKWYSLMCKRYGIKDELNTEKPRIRFL